MTSRRALLALALVGLAAPLPIQASCVSIVGVDLATHVSAVHDMCLCEQLGDLGKPAKCEATLNARFDGVGSIDSTAWLAKYTHDCTECDGVLACLAQSPTCVLGKCTIDEECCQVDGSPTKKTCIQGFCDVL